VGDPMNDLACYQNIFDGIAPYSGTVPAGYIIDCFGQLTELEFRTLWLDQEDESLHRDRPIETTMPTLNSGEGWFEMMNWVAAAREARGNYVMMTLGACYGAQAVGAYLALQRLNPMPARLVAIEAIGQNIAWLKRQFISNGIDPDDHWVIEAALGVDNQPSIFPVGGPGIGNQSYMGYNSPEGRQNIIAETTAGNFAATAFANVIRSNGTGIELNLVPETDHEVIAELRFVSTVTLLNLLAPFDRVDFIEADLQSSENEIFPPAMASLTKKVRRVHLGTHGRDNHDAMEELFRDHGWDIVFSYRPDCDFETPYGSWRTLDGVLTALNPAVAY
jgi:hypothetical protein